MCCCTNDLISLHSQYCPALKTANITINIQLKLNCPGLLSFGPSNSRFCIS